MSHDEPNITDRPTFDEVFMKVIIRESLSNFAITEDDVEIVFEEVWYKGDLTADEKLEIANRANKLLAGILEFMFVSADKSSPSYHLLKSKPSATHLRQTIKAQTAKRRKQPKR